MSAAEMAGIRDGDDEPLDRVPTDPLEAVRDRDPCDWIEGNFYIPDTATATAAPGKLIKLRLWQKAITRLMFTRREDGRFPFQTLVFSSVKKSGKSTWAACVLRWLAETQVRYGDLFTIGNDMDQAMDRSFKFVAESIELTPGYDRGRDRLPGRWAVFKKSLRCLVSQSRIRAIAVDAKGEAGGRPYCSVWTELWGFEHADARKFWTEMTPVPTVPDSMRIVETYAGFDGESLLLWGLYERGMTQGRQLTNGELARVAARDRDGERYEDFLHAFAETNGDPDALVPVWIEGRMCMFWDSGVQARRNPEEQTVEYYDEERKSHPPQEFSRIHENLWGAAVDNAIPVHLWDACFDPDLPLLLPGSNEPIVLSCDAASSSDCFAITAVSRHPKDHDRPALRALRMWKPSESDDGRVQYIEPEKFLRWCVANFNVVQIAYDPYQLEDMMQRLARELGIWCEAFPQGKDRLIADKRLYDSVVQRTLAWNFHNDDQASAMREHLTNANKKVQKDQDSYLRFVKKHENRKIDLLVAASMGVHRCMTLLI